MRRSLVLLAIMLAVFTAPAAAHHSIAMFDNQNPTTLTGTVKEFIWANPHGHLVIDVKERRNDKGQVENTTPEEWVRRAPQHGDHVAARMDAHLFQIR